jgi:hypothetical protein
MLVTFTSWLVVRRVSFLVFLKGTYIIIIQKQGIISVYLKALVFTLLYHIFGDENGEPNIFCNIKKHLFCRINCHQIQVIIQILFKNRIYVKNQTPSETQSSSRIISMSKVRSPSETRSPSRT